MRYLLLLALMMATPSAAALDPKLPLAEAAIEVWDRRSGLPSDTIGHLAQTTDGLLWVSTDIGLMAFDGASFERFTTADTPALPANAINLLATAGDTLWIGTIRGLARWRAGTFERVDDEAVQGSAVMGLFIRRDGAPWITTAKGLFSARGDDAAAPFLPVTRADNMYCYDFVELRDATLSGACSDLTGFSDDGVSTRTKAPASVVRMAVAGDGTRFVGLAHGGAYRVVGERFEQLVPREDPVMALFVDSHDALWVGGAGPSAQRRTADGRVEELLLPGGLVVHGVEGITEGHDGSILIGSGVGLIRVRDAAFRTRDDRSGLPREVLSIYEDRARTVWIASASDPLLKGLAPATTKNKEVPLGAPALTHLETPDGTHYVGTPAGLMRIVGDRAESVALGVDLVVGALALAPDGALWLADPGEGTARFADGTLTWVKRQNGTMIKAAAMLLARDGKTLWLGSGLDVCRIDGVDLGIGAPARCLAGKEGVPAALVTWLLEDATGAIWAGTFEGGLVRIRGEVGVVLTEDHGLPSNTQYALLEDTAANLWISHPTGVMRVPRAELDAVADGRAGMVHPRLYGVADGLPVDEMSGGMMTAFKAHDGRLWFATPRGSVSIDPARPDLPAVSPPSTIVALKVGARALPHVGGTAESHERELQVRYTAPTLDRARELRFRYRLEGVDDDWVDAGARRIAMYTDLPPGRHVFRVAAMAAGASAWGAEATFTLAVEAAFAETVVFKALMALLSLLLLYVGHRLRVAGLVAREARLGRLVDVRTHELAEAKTQLEDLNASLAERVDRTVAALRSSERIAAYGHTVAGIAHEVRQPLFALGTAAYVLTDKLRDRPELEREVKLLDRETKRVNRVMDELLDFAKPRELLLAPTPIDSLLRETVEVFRAEHDPEAKVSITIEPATGLPPVKVDAERLSQVLVNLMTNARKHAANMTRIVVRALADGDRALIEVDDDGSGIAPADLPYIFDPFVTTGGTGLGLAIARRIVEEHHGTLTVRSSEHGTVFRVSLPIEVAHA